MLGLKRKHLQPWCCAENLLLHGYGSGGLGLGVHRLWTPPGLQQEPLAQDRGVSLCVQVQSSPNPRELQATQPEGLQNFCICQDLVTAEQGDTGGQLWL